MSKRSVIKEWNDNFEQIGITDTIRESYNIYITKLVNNNAPVIFDLSHLAKLLGRTPQFLSAVINSPKSFYREFEIPKKTEGKRIINAPYPSLLECQNWIYTNILLKIKIHPAAQAYTLKKSIITNAKIHVKEESFLKIDIKDFFPSIKQSFIINIFKQLGYSHKVAFYLSCICCVDDSLPQGAPSSPMLSNIIFRSADNRLHNLAEKFGYNYSRYADDLIFSGVSIPVAFIKYVTTIIESCGFLVNSKKTYISNPNGKKIITGISIANKTLKVPNAYSRKLKQEVFFIRKYGLLSHMSKLKIKDINYPFSILGKLQFWRSVEPENEFVNESIKAINSIIKKSDHKK